MPPEITKDTSEKSAAKKAARRKALIQAYKMINTTPPDERGLVPDTNLSEAGVARMMEKLQARTKQSGEGKGKRAERLLGFLQAEDTEPATPSGASIKKIQQLEERVSKMQERRQERKNMKA